LLADQVLEVRMRKGQVHLLRRPRIEDPEDRPMSMMEAIGWEEKPWAETVPPDEI
jgi:hypothetical protein